MDSIAILAYGSLVDDPGDELGPLVSRCIEHVKTPFCVEFARSSSSRDGAPTLVPVEVGGCPIDATLLVLDPTVKLTYVEDILWRRETRNEDLDKHYMRPCNPTRDSVLIERVSNFSRVETVFYIKIGQNIEKLKLTSNHLADLAIKSARGQAGAKRMDGISYLLSVIKNGVSTPLLPKYRADILKKTQTRCLVEAYFKIRSKQA